MIRQRRQANPRRETKSFFQSRGVRDSTASLSDLQRYQLVYCRSLGNSDHYGWRSRDLKPPTRRNHISASNAYLVKMRIHKISQCRGHGNSYPPNRAQGLGTEMPNDQPPTISTEAPRGLPFKLHMWSVK